VTCFGFPTVKWRQLSGEVSKFVNFRSQVFPGFQIPRIIKVDQFLVELCYSKTKKVHGQIFWGQSECVAYVSVIPIESYQRLQVTCVIRYEIETLFNVRRVVAALCPRLGLQVSIILGIE